MARVLVLRPEPGASTTVERARALQLDAIAHPLFEVSPVAWEAPELSSFDGLLLTSANALRHGGAGLEALRGLKVYTVGEATAGLAREAGFDIAATGEAGVQRLLASIEPDLRLLHLCGAERQDAGEVRQTIVPIVAYRSIAVDARKLPEADVVLVHSARAGERLAELAQDRPGMAVAAISRGAADAVGDGWRAVEVADAPNDDALLALAARLCNKPPPK
jgi:uroporphyrinogen-III synthase